LHTNEHAGLKQCCFKSITTKIAFRLEEIPESSKLYCIWNVLLGAVRKQLFSFDVDNWQDCNQWAGNSVGIVPVLCL